MVASVRLGNGNVAAGVSPGAFATDAAAGPADVGIPSETSAGEAAATAATALAWLHLVRGGKVDDLPTGLFSLPPDLFWLSVRLVKFTRSGNLPPGRERIRTDRCRFSERTESFSAAGKTIGIDPLGGVWKILYQSAVEFATP